VIVFPSRFDYEAPRSLDEVLSRLEQRGDEAKVLAGGQSLIPLMKLRFASPALIIDLNRVPGLSYIDEGSEHLRIGALARNRELASSQLLKDRYPVMAAAAPLISDPVVRNLGTMGGSLAHADPAGDWGSVLMALGAEIVAKSKSNERVIPVRELFSDTFTTVLEPNEVLTEIRVPLPAASSGGTYLKLERKVGDFATVAVATRLDLDDGKVGRAGIALTAVGPTNIRATAAEESLAGAEPTNDAFAEAGRLAAGAASPVTDVRGTADYKRQIVRTFVKRGLATALEQARGN
jgi:aerobic carbon-monoxide dehydrogenase medium subunit